LKSACRAVDIRLKGVYPISPLAHRAVVIFIQNPKKRNFMRELTMFMARQKEKPSRKTGIISLVRKSLEKTRQQIISAVELTGEKTVMTGNYYRSVPNVPRRR
jgi:hypothetical protein